MEVSPAVGGEDVAAAMGTLRELILTLATLRGFVAETPPPPPAMPPHNDWLIPLSFLVVAAASLLALLSYFFFRCSRCRTGAGGGESGRLMMDNECAIAGMVLVLFVLCSAASFYYHYCFRAGCFGTGGAAVTGAAAPGGRKFLSTMTTR